MRPRMWLVATCVTGALLWMTAAVAVGYTSQVPSTLTIRANAVCSGPTTIVATVVGVDGKPVGGQTVDWSLTKTPSSSDTIGKTSVTNAKGVATTTLTIAPVGGSRTVRAKAGPASASAVVQFACFLGLPNTARADGAAAPRGVPVAWWLLLVIPVAGLLAFVLSRRAASR